MVLDRADGLSSQSASLSMAVELLEGWVDAAPSNGVHWGIWSALVTTLVHFLELEAKLELLGSDQNVSLIEDQEDAL
jgi:hypothetical protein